MMYPKTQPRRPGSHSPIERLEGRLLLAAHVVVNEIMYHASSNNPADEWLELYNAGDAPADMSGWQFTKGMRYTFAQGTTLGAGQYLVLARDLARFQAKYPSVGNVVGGYQGSLSNNGDTLRLDDASGNEQNSLTYGSEGDWAQRRVGPLDNNHRGWVWTTPADGGGRTMELINPALDNGSGQNWAPSLIDQGTPGAANSVRSSDIAPEILDLSQTPLVPKSTDPVTITAHIVDEQPTGQTVTIHWRDDGAASFQTVPMFDDGAHGDGAAGDGVYGGIIPAQANNTVVEFYASATDSTGHTRTWPAPTDTAGTQGANALYQVDDTVYTGTQPIYKLIMKEAERAELAQIGSAGFPEAFSNAQMNGTVILQDGNGSDLRYTVGIRNRGGGSRNAQPNNYRVDIPNDHRLRGQRAMSFNGQYSMEDVAGSAVIRNAGLVTQQVTPVQVRVNNVNLASPGQFDMFGSYSMTEPENTDYVTDQFPTDSNGNLYSGVSFTHSNTLTYLGSDPSLYSGYTKQTNSEVNDYSDLIALIRALDPTQTPDANFVQTLEQHANVVEWARYFAANSLIGNEETSLATGYGDDYLLYRGVNDPRFQLLSRDLDTILGRGDSPNLVNPNESIFKATTVAAVNRFLKNPAFAPIYFAQLKELAQTAFSPSQIGPTLDNALKGYVPQTVIDSMKQFAAQRVEGVLAQIPQTLTATSSLAVQNGYAHTTATTAPLSGQADAINTRSVLVNGVPAAYTPWQGAWTAPAVPLNPGINAVLVQALDGSGKEIGRTYFDVWRDTGTSTTVAGTLPAGVTHWTVAAAPYHVTGTVTVPAGSTLVIDPGVSVFFDPNTGLTVNGTLTAVGADTQRIDLARTPTASGAWDRVLVTNTQADSKIGYTTMENAGSGSENIQIINARLDMDHLEWLGTTTHIVDLVNASFRLTNSVIPTVVGVEPCHFLGMPANGYALVQGNTFGTTTGHNDIFDFTGGARPGPIFYIIGNVFTGTGTNGQPADDILDVDGTDAHIEGNLFMNVVHSPINDTNSAISGGNYDYGNGPVSSNVVSTRNIYYNCDQAIMMKEGNFFSSINDTIVNCPTAAFVFDEPNFAAYPGRGGYIEGDVLYNVPHIFANVNDSGTTTQITVNHTIDPGVVLPGIGNLALDPQLVNTTNVTDPWQDFRLKPTSPAIGAGPNGRDMGALIPAGASIAGEPPAQTYLHSATLTVGSPGIYAYMYRVNNGPWSAAINTLNPGTPSASIPPIQLTNLPDGTYTVDVVVKDDAGVWQSQSQPTVSKTWTVDSNYSRLLINEVLADNQAAVNHEGTFPDVVELYNDSAQPRDLSGLSISDDPANAKKYVFPQGTTIDAGGYLVLYANKVDGTSGIHLGFALDKDGEDLRLYDASGTQLDDVKFGRQVQDLSIGRLADGSWGLTQPTFGSPNVAQPLGDPSKLKINEWLTNGLPPFGDFIELYNPDPSPVPLGGLTLTDHPTNWPDRSPIAPLSFIPGNGFIAFDATGDNTPGTREVDFRLADERGMIGLFDQNKTLIDLVIYGSQSAGVSQGRSPDGGPEYEFFPTPNPAVTNPAPLPPHTQNYNLFPITAVWKYNQNGDQGTAWRQAGFDDTSWSSGGGLLYVETSPLPAPKTTALTLGKTTYYFRRHFTLPVDPSQLVSLQLQTVLDDGAVVYINGQEVFRLGMPGGAVTYNTFANRGVDNAVYEGPFNLPLSALVQGDNVIEVEVHQVNATSSDIVWGATLQATANIPVNTDIPSLRITELNYNPAPPPQGSKFTSDDYEFIELENTGSQPLSLGGTKLAAGVSFTFPDQTLAPGQYVLVVKNAEAFASRYGTGFNIAGQYTDTLNNAGEELRLLSSSGASILDFAYAASWYPDTNGGRKTLVFRDPLVDTSLWDKASSWRASTSVGGSPDATDPTGSGVVGRWVFYNHSKFTAAGNDDKAIATDKGALLPGHAASFLNYTSYDKGINGIMVDIAGLPAGVNLTSDDFVFHAGTTLDPTTWGAAPAPSSIVVRPNAGGNGVARVELVWPDGLIRNEWLQVTVKSDANTGLPAADVFYFGNLVGESGNLLGAAAVDAADEAAARNDPHNFRKPADVTNAHDYNRDGRVDATDQLIARHNAGGLLNLLDLLSATTTAVAAQPAAQTPTHRKPVARKAPAVHAVVTPQRVFKKIDCLAT